MDISNKSLAFILVVAIVISLGGTIVSLNKLNQFGFTGAATGTGSGTANLTVNSSVIITFLTSKVDFGTGNTNDTGAGIENCTIDTNGTNPRNDGSTIGSWGTQSCIGFNSNVAPFVIRNDGNLNVNLTLQSSASPSAFIGGTFPAFQWALNTTNACPGGNLNPVAWQDVNTSAQNVCTNYSYVDGSDLLTLNIRVNIPQDAVPGTHAATITATGTA